MMMCLFHKWGKWEQYEIDVPARRISKNWALCAAKEYRQRRLCSKCGKAQDQLINTVVEG